MVQAMVGLVQEEAQRIDSRFLEPACGSGNFLVPVLRLKLHTVDVRYARSEFEKRHQGLLALMSLYGIEILADNVAECRANLLEVFVTWLGAPAQDDWIAAATSVLDVNIVHGDALAMTTAEMLPQPITFAEWSYLGRGRYNRRDFRLDTMAQMSAFGEAGSLFADVGSQEVFTPTRDHGTLSVRDIGGGDRD
jgi:hypothetical protein